MKKLPLLALFGLLLVAPLTPAFADHHNDSNCSCASGTCSSSKESKGKNCADCDHCKEHGTKDGTTGSSEGSCSGKHEKSASHDSNSKAASTPAPANTATNN